MAVWQRISAIAVLTASMAAGSGAAGQEGSWRLLIDYSETNKAGMAAIEPSSQFTGQLMAAAGMPEYVTDEAKCAAGRKIFLGGAQAEGRFLPGGEQTLAHFLTRDCGEESHRAKGHIVLLQDGKIDAYLQPECAVRPDAIVDAPDGRLQRLIAGCGFNSSGYLEMEAGIFGFRDGEFRRIRKLGNVYADNCGVDLDYGKENVVVIFERKSDGELRIKNYERTCLAQAEGRKEYEFLHNGPMKVDY